MKINILLQCDALCRSGYFAIAGANDNYPLSFIDDNFWDEDLPSSGM